MHDRTTSKFSEDLTRFISRLQYYFNYYDEPDGSGYSLDSFNEDLDLDEAKLHDALRKLGYTKDVYEYNDDDDDEGHIIEELLIDDLINRLETYNPVDDHCKYGLHVIDVLDSVFRSDLQQNA